MPRYKIVTTRVFEIEIEAKTKEEAQKKGEQRIEENPIAYYKRRNVEIRRVREE